MPALLPHQPVQLPVPNYTHTPSASSTTSTAASASGLDRRALPEDGDDVDDPRKHQYQRRHSRNGFRDGGGPGGEAYAAGGKTDVFTGFLHPHAESTELFYPQVLGQQISIGFPPHGSE
jgi:hypothetical protein